MTTDRDSATGVLDDESGGREAASAPSEVTQHKTPRTLLGGLIRTARPRQWTKNVLVFAAPGAAGVLTRGDVVLTTVGALAVFCLAASGTYFVNDALDADADRLHPEKRFRPVPAGIVSVGLAKVFGALLLVASIGLAFALAGWPLTLVVGGYAALQLLYTVWLKHMAVIDLAAVASGFVLRAIAGGVAVDVPISHWFLIVTSFGSLFIVSGKRHAEHVDLGEDRGEHRATLNDYSLDFLHYVRSTSSAVTLAAYLLWAFEKARNAAAPVWFEISILPFVLATLRFGLLLDAGKGGSPEQIVLEDRPLQVLGLAWVVTFLVGVYAG